VGAFVSAAVAIGQEEQERPRVLGTSSSIRIDADDSRELYWVHTDPLVAGAGSNSGCFGAMLARAEMFAVKMYPCKRCGGDKHSDRAGTGSCHRDGRTYAVELRKYRRAKAKELKLRLVATSECAAEWRALGIPAASGEEIAEELPERLTKHCQRCSGTGMVPGRPPRSGPQTARPTGSSKGGNNEPSVMVDEGALQRYGRMSRLLAEVHRRSAEARAAIGIYFAPGSEGIPGLWPLTEAGRKFVSGLDNPHKLNPFELLHSEREAQRQNPNAGRAIVFGSIARECAECWHRTCKTWNDVRFACAARP